MINTLEDLRDFGYDIDNLTEYDWVNISTYQNLSEHFIEKYRTSNSFIEKYNDKLNMKLINNS